jgi:hypothetical protein
MQRHPCALFLEGSHKRGGLQIPHRLRFGLLKRGEVEQRLQGLPAIARGLEQAFDFQSVGGFADMEKLRASFKLMSTDTAKKDKTAGRYA